MLVYSEACTKGKFTFRKQRVFLASVRHFLFYSGAHSCFLVSVAVIRWLYICVFVQDDGRFLRELFTLLQDEATPEDKYRELVQTLH